MTLTMLLASLTLAAPGAPGAATPAPSTTARAAAGPSVHPPVTLRDPDGQPVIVSGGPISARQSCGECHDAAWIEGHSYHALLGADRAYPAGEGPRPWDTFAGPFGRWDALTYRRLSAPEEARADADLSTWAKVLGPRHVGGGPFAALRRGAEMNCLMCHTEGADEAARRRAVRSGRLEWSSTASLEGTSVVTATAGGWRYAPEAFDAEHRVSANALRLDAAPHGACGACHGAVPEPHVEAVELGVADWSAPDPRATTGLVYSGQPMHDSAVNLAGKAELTRTWDIHAERLLSCSSCHGPLNDPAGGAKRVDETQRHLRFDARSEKLKDYLRRPQHDFATGYAAPGALGAAHQGSMRRCEDCHDAGGAHEWLPYAQRHTSALLCESCHVPKVHAPLLETVDWSLITPEGRPRLSYRGVQGDPADARSLVEGVVPVFLARRAPGAKLGPHNLVTAFYWVEDDGARPVRPEDLKQAFLQGEGYHPAVVAALDEDGDGRLGAAELHLMDRARVEALARRLEAVGVPSPALTGEIQPYGLHHQVAGKGFALKQCTSCHSASSRLIAPMRLAARPPAGVEVGLVADAPVQRAGHVRLNPQGELHYHPDARLEGVYVLGSPSAPWVDGIGWLALALVLLGSGLHGAARIFVARNARGGRA